MKSPPTATDDCDDIFGPPRTYANGYYPPKNRPSMISAKYRQKEERRKVLKISVSKLRGIEDPEVNLCRSVLINNTMKRLQKEARDEKIQKQQLNYPRCYDNDNFLNLKSEFIKNELKHSAVFEEPQDSFTSNDSKLMASLNEDFAIENDFDAKIPDEIASDTVKNMEVLNGLVEENLNNLGVNVDNNSVNAEIVSDSDSFVSRKRSYDDMEDCDVQDVLSQFYMPPTPRMLTCIDDDEDVNVVDDEPLPKRVKTDELNIVIDPPKASAIESSLPQPLLPSNAQFDSASNQKREDSFCQTFDPSRGVAEFELNKVSERKQDDCEMNNFMNNNITETDLRLRYVSAGQNLDSDSNSYSCGHASLFNELQSNVFHSLIASLET